VERAGVCVCVCGRIIHVDLVTVLRTKGGGIEVAHDTVQLLVAVDTGTTFERTKGGE
jgi:hypothetical protein